MYRYAIIAALLVFSFGFTSAFADETFVNPENLILPHGNQFTPSQQIIDPLTGEYPVVDNSRDYTLYPIEHESIIVSDEKQLISIDDDLFYLVPAPLDKTANMFAVLLLGVPFGLLVYRMSDNDPIPLKYAKLSGVVVAFSMASMLTMPITIGNTFWGYASAETELNIPKPIDSLYFDTGNNYLSHGTTIILDEKNSAISFDGDNDYLVLDSYLSEKLDEFTVSAWIKPDYKKGAPATLSIVSEADAFELAINNDKVDKNFAIFSVFDGIKWHQVESKSAISEQWTHISATYSEGQIKIFVNGVQEDSQSIDGDYSLTHQYGESNQNSYDYISAKSDILIGAFNPSIRDTSSTQNHFSGLIDDITLYDKLLSSDNISALEKINRTPDAISKSEVQSVETSVEQTGTENEYGFVSDSDNPNDQKIEEVAAEGYKVKKPEDNKKKDKVVTEKTPKATEEPAEKIIDEFDEGTILIATSSTTSVCHIPPGNPANNKTLTIEESALDAHKNHGDMVPDCQTFGWKLPIILERKAPQSVETIEDAGGLATQLVRVSSDTGSTFSDLPIIHSRAEYQWKLYGDLNGTMVDLTNDPNVDLQLLDLDSDNRVDRAEWSTMDGITEYYLVAKIILATNASHLDSNRDYVDDIFYEIKEQDGIWTYPIPEGDFVRVTFERDLSHINDITVYAKSSGTATIEVYEKDGTELLATFESIDAISSPSTFRILLTNLVGFQDTFDLKIIGDAIEFDLIIDPSKSVEQCKNGGIGDTPKSCHDKGAPNDNWVTGNVNGQKSHWQEGDFLPYRALEGIGSVGSDPTISSKYAFDTAKSSEDKHAIDYLSSFNLTENNALTGGSNAGGNDPCSGGKVMGSQVPLFAGCDVNQPDDNFAIPVPSGLTSNYANWTPTCAGGSWMGSETSGDLYGWVSGGLGLTINNITFTQVGPNGPDDVVDESATDCPAEFTVNYTINGPTNSSTTVMFAWGGHVSSNEDSGGGHWGTPHAIPTGSPYHMRVGDSTIAGQFENFGNQELQLSATAIQRESSIVVSKFVESNETDTTGFTFDTTGDGYNTGFILENGTSNTTIVPHTVVINPTNNNTSIVGSNFTIAETLPPGYELINATCVGTNSIIHGDGNNPDPSNFQVAEGEVVICTFWNKLSEGTIIVKKITEPEGSEELFTFNGNFTDSSFQLMDGENSTTTGLIPGIYNASETVPIGWNLTSTVCEGSDGAEDANALNLTAGETITCTFTNTQQGTIIVKKITEPEGSEELFTFNGNFTDSSFQLMDGENSTTTGLVPGIYNASETVPFGWILTSTVCEGSDGPEDANALDLGANETITCTFNNSLTNAFLKIIKKSNATAILGDEEVIFEFNINGTAGTYLSLNETSKMNMTDIIETPIGNYNVFEEAPPAGWMLKGSECFKWNSLEEWTGGVIEGDSVSPSDFDLGSSEIAVCTFTNDNTAYLKIKKITASNVTENTTFNFNATLENGTSIFPTVTVDSGTNMSMTNLIKVPAGNTTISEIDFPPGYSLQDSICDVRSVYNNGTLGDVVDENVTEINLLPWQAVECTFTNDNNAFIKVIKNTTNPTDIDTTFNFTANLSNGTALPLSVTVLEGTSMDMTDIILVPAGLTSITELTAPAGWKLQDSICDVREAFMNGTLGNVVTENVTEINLLGGQALECTFTNDNTAFVKIKKTTTSNTWEDTTFYFEVNVSNGTTLEQSLTVLNGTNMTATGKIQIPAGNTTISEINLPAGWKDTKTGTCDLVEVSEIDEPMIVLENDVGLGEIELLPWQALYCEFINDNTSFIKIIKNTTNPTDADTTFNFTATLQNGIVLEQSLTVLNGTNMTMTDLIEVPSGNTTISELTPPAGWKLQDSICDVHEVYMNGTLGGLVDGKNNVTLPADLLPWEGLVCTFINDNTSFIKIIKNTTNPTDKDEIFSFNYTDATDVEKSTTVTVLNGTSMNMTDLIQVPSGLTSIEELTPPAGWKLQDFICDVHEVYMNGTLGGLVDGKNNVTLPADLLPWEGLVCTFTNDNTSFIKIIKNTTNPTDKDEIFSFNYTDATDVEKSTTVTVLNGTSMNMTDLIQVPSGLTSIEELTPPAGWKLQDSICDVHEVYMNGTLGGLVDGKNNVTLPADLLPWEGLVCTFTNDNTSFIKIIKNTTNPTDKDEIFSFNYTDATDVEKSTTVTVLNGTSMNMTDLIQVPSGLTSIEELTPPAGWKLQDFICDVHEVYMNGTLGGLVDGKNNVTLPADLLPWEGLVCTFTNDNTSFIKIIKNTTNPTDKDEIFSFNYTDATDVEKSTTVTVLNGTSMNMTDLIQVPSGLTSIEELTPPAGWKLQDSICDVHEVYMNGTLGGLVDGKNNVTLPADLLPWEGLVCTFTNDNTSFIKIIKNTTNPTDKDEIFSFNYTDAVGTSSITTVTVLNGTSMNMTDLIQVPSGLTSIEELTPPAGWKLQDSICDVHEVYMNGTLGGLVDGKNNVTLPADLLPWEGLVCTFTNDNTAFVKIKKTTTNNTWEDTTFYFEVNVSNGTTLEQSLTVLNGTNMTSTDLIQVPAGTTSIEELTPPAGWKLQDSICDVYEVSMDGTLGGVVESNVTEVDLLPWQALYCEFTNDNTSFIKIIKNTTNPTDADTTFNFTATLQNGIVLEQSLTVLNGTNMTMTDLIEVPSGNTTISELTPPAGWKLQDSICDVHEVYMNGTLGGLVDGKNNVTLPADLLPWEGLVCTFTNDNTSFIKIIKNTTNPTDKDEIFSFNYTDATDVEKSTTVTVLNGTSMNMTDLIQVPSGLTSIEELTPPAGWKLQDFICDVHEVYMNGTLGGLVDGKNNVTLPADLLPWEGLVCTFTNDNTSFIKIIKNTTNPTDKDEIFSFNYTDATDVEKSTTVTVLNGTSMNMTDLIQVPSGLTSIEELTPPAGWKLQDSICDVHEVYMNGTLGGLVDGKNNVTLPADLLPWEGLVCTFTNDNTSFIKIIKNTTNPTDKDEIFSFNYTDAVGTSSITTVTVLNGTSMNMTDLIQVPSGLTSIEELTPPAGWKLQDSICDVHEVYMNGTLGGLVDGKNNVTLPADLLPWEGLVCTFTNDNTAFVKIKKTTTNNTWEDTTFYFEVNVSNGTTLEQSLTVLNGTNMTSTDLIQVPAGTTSIEELTPPAGWKLQDSICDVYEVSMDGTLGGVVESNVTEVDLLPWQALYCEFTNDNTSFIKIIKNTTNPTDADTTFNFTATLQNGIVLEQSLTVLNGTNMTMTDLIEVPSGNTTISELTPPAGWKLQDSICDVHEVYMNGTLGGVVESNVTEVDLLPWQALYCEFTNDNTSFIKIIKNTTNPTDADTTFNFTATLQNGIVLEQSLTVLNGTNMTMTDLIEVPSGNTTISELTPPAGWKLQDSICDVHEVYMNGTLGGLVDGKNNVTLPADLLPWEGLVCTFTNDNTSFIKIIKNTTNPTDKDEIFSFNYTDATDVEKSTTVTVLNGTSMNMTDLIQVPSGLTSIEELTPPAGWKLQDFICDVHEVYMNGTLGGLVDGKNNVTLPADLLPWEGLVCTFTNDNTSFIKIIKNTTNPTDKDEIFSFNYTDATDVEKSTTVTVLNGTSMNMTDLIQVPSGLTSIEELTPPAGWKLQDSICDVHEVYMNGTLGGLVDGKNNVTLPADLLPWEGLVCTFTNDNTSFIKIIKNTTNPTDKDEIFSFNYTDAVGTSSITTVTVLNGTSMNMTDLIQVPSGLTSIEELTPPAGWKLQDSICDVHEVYMNGTLGGLVDGKNNVTLPADLLPWEGLVCTFTNDNTAFVKIKKTTTNNTWEDTTFYFEVNVSNGTTLEQSLTVLNGTNMTSTDLIQVPAGTTSIEELTPPAGWKLQDSICDVHEVYMNGTLGGVVESNVTEVDLLPWQALYCEFINDNTSFVKVKKTTTANVTEDATFYFNLTTAVGTSSITTVTVLNGTNMTMTDLIQVPSGLTSIEEIDLPDGWSFEMYSCNVITYNENFDVLNNMTADNSTTLEPWQSLECNFVNDGGNRIARTQGFWSTHIAASTIVWGEGDDGSNGLVSQNRKNLCTEPDKHLMGDGITDIEEMMGGFWSSIPKKTDGSSRTAEEHAAMQLLQQWLAAVMNEAIGNTVYGTLLDDAQDALCDSGSSAGYLHSLASDIDIINNGGHDIELPEGIPLGADPKTAKALADHTEWDMVFP